MGNVTNQINIPYSLIRILWHNIWSVFQYTPALIGEPWGKSSASNTLVILKEMSFQVENVCLYFISLGSEVCVYSSLTHMSSPHWLYGSRSCRLTHYIMSKKPINCSAILHCDVQKVSLTSSMHTVSDTTVFQIKSSFSTDSRSLC